MSIIPNVENDDTRWKTRGNVVNRGPQKIETSRRNELENIDDTRAKETGWAKLEML